MASSFDIRHLRLSSFSHFLIHVWESLGYWSAPLVYIILFVWVSRVLFKCIDVANTCYLIGLVGLPRSLTRPCYSQQSLSCTLYIGEVLKHITSNVVLLQEPCQCSLWAGSSASHLSMNPIQQEMDMDILHWRLSSNPTQPHLGFGIYQGTI